MGFESIANASFLQGNQQTPSAGAANGAVALSLPVAADAELRTLVEAWPALPEPIKAGIVAMIKAAVPSGGCAQE